jgi:hypothetical protein
MGDCKRASPVPMIQGARLPWQLEGRQGKGEDRAAALVEEARRTPLHTAPHPPPESQNSSWPQGGQDFYAGLGFTERVLQEWLPILPFSFLPGASSVLRIPILHLHDAHNRPPSCPSFPCPAPPQQEQGPCLSSGRCVSSRPSCSVSLEKESHHHPPQTGFLKNLPSWAGSWLSVPKILFPQFGNFP